jgi:uncharacterized protein YjbJ (UPF0337 family)
MNEHTFKGDWKQFKGEIKKQWGKLTDDDLTQVEGHFDKLAGRIQERYGYAKDRAEQEVNAFREKYPEPTMP